MAKKLTTNTTLSNSVGGWTSTNTLTAASSSPFVVNTTNVNNSLEVDNEGNCIVKSLILIDENGDKWGLKVVNCELVIQPLDVRNMRSFKLEKILNEKTSE
jgi:hypothetical protein